MKTLGLIAGNKNLPIKVINWAKKNNIDLCVIGIKNITNPIIKKDKFIKKYIELHITELSKAINFFKINNVNDIVIIGGIHNAKFKLTFDFIKLFTKLLFIKKKYDGILRLVINEFEKNNINVIGIDDILKENLIPKGILTTTKPTNTQLNEIKNNWQNVINFANTDKGQSIILLNNKIIATETFKGTDDLIKRAYKIKGNIKGGILIKILKPNQERRADLPVIGKKTIENLKLYNFSGIAIEGNNAIFEDKEETIKTANENQIFIIGI